MNWIESLYNTFEKCKDTFLGAPHDVIPLIPVAHIVQLAQIEITIDKKGNFQQASIVEAASPATIIPCTEGSAGRTNGIAAHPLVDKLKYVAGDYYSYVKEKPPKPDKERMVETHHSAYLDLLAAWVASKHRHPSVEAVHKYVKRGTVLADLCAAKIYLRDASGMIPKSWKNKTGEAPPIYAATAKMTNPWDAFVRWKVEVPGEPEDRTFFDCSLWNSWTDYYLSTPGRTGRCLVIGNEARLAIQHPKKIRNLGDGAKLISSNDSSGFTFRGRFTDPNGDQACGVSFDVTQKAHNALRWLIARQGRRDGGQAIVAWADSGQKLPQFIDASDSLFDEDNSEPVSASENATADAGQEYALRLQKAIRGYRAKLADATDIFVLAMDSATPGRMAITYSRELAPSEFLERIENWHESCSWHQNFGKDRKFTGAPAPRDIAKCAYGRRLDDKLLASTHRRLLPCILDGRVIPDDLVIACQRRAESRAGQNHWDWERALGIACALYRKQQFINHKYDMALERNRTTRDYLYGRLLAVADHLEGAALTKDEARESNAARLMQRFADYPFSTWRKIELSLTPYRRRLKANAPKLLARYDQEFLEIMDTFDSDEFKLDEKLTGEFLLAFHCQRSALWQKWPKVDVGESTEENYSQQTETVNPEQL